MICGNSVGCLDGIAAILESPVSICRAGEDLQGGLFDVISSTLTIPGNIWGYEIMLQWNYIFF